MIFIVRYNAVFLMIRRKKWSKPNSNSSKLILKNKCQYFIQMLLIVLILFILYVFLLYTTLNLDTHQSLKNISYIKYFPDLV